MQILSWNIDGIKRIVKEGFTEWLQKYSPDILCLQETHFPRKEVSMELREPYPYRSYWDFEDDINFSGVATYTKTKPNVVHYDVGLPWFDEHGKIMVLEYDNFTLVNVRFPHGSKATGTLDMKYKSMREFLNYVRSLRGKRLIICGTFNVAHRNIDIEQPKAYENRATFTTKEKEYMDQILGTGLVDTFRMFNQDTRNYTYWRDQRNKDTNVGKRLDYVLVSNNIVRTVKKGFILSNVNVSDHCPVGIELKI